MASTSPELSPGQDPPDAGVPALNPDEGDPTLSPASMSTEFSPSQYLNEDAFLDPDEVVPPLSSASMSTELSPDQGRPNEGVPPLNPDEDVPPSSSVAKTTDFNFRHFFIEVYRSNVPSHITDRLTGCLPYSLPLLRRLQFATNFEGIGQKMEWNRILIYVGFKPSRDLDGHFAAAYFDPMLRQQCWIYASFEQHVPFVSLYDEIDEVTLPQLKPTQDQLKETHKPYPSFFSTDQADAEDMLITVLRRMRHVETEYWAYKAQTGVEAVPTARPGWVSFGCMDKFIRRVLLSRGVRVALDGYRANPKAPGAKAPEGKEYQWITNYVFRTDFCRDWNKDSDMLLVKGFRWDVVQVGDLELLKGKMNIDQDKLLIVPSMVIRNITDGRLIAWGCLTEDGRATNGEVDNPPFPVPSTALIRRLVRFHQENFGPDGWGNFWGTPDDNSDEPNATMKA